MGRLNWLWLFYYFSLYVHLQPSATASVFDVFYLVVHARGSLLFSQLNKRNARTFKSANRVSSRDSSISSCEPTTEKPTIMTISKSKRSSNENHINQHREHCVFIFVGCYLSFSFSHIARSTHIHATRWARRSADTPTLRNFSTARGVTTANASLMT